MNLTPKQLAILNRIRETRLTRGYSPTMQELGEALGVSKVTVFEHVEALIKKGCPHPATPTRRALWKLSPDLELPDEERQHQACRWSAPSPPARPSTPSKTASISTSPSSSPRPAAPSAATPSSSRSAATP